jgi:hypothetical protein
MAVRALRRGCATLRLRRGCATLRSISTSHILSQQNQPQPVGLLGVLEDRHYSYMNGSSRAPPLIRLAMRSDSANAFSELGVDALAPLTDFGDLERPTAAEVRDKMAEIMAPSDGGPGACRPLVLGGDHSVSFPVFEVRMCFRCNRVNCKRPACELTTALTSQLHWHRRHSMSSGPSSKRLTIPLSW